MVFGEILNKMLKTEKNAVNRMYLNEIVIKWKKIESKMEESDEPIPALVEALNDFMHVLQNPKFKYDAKTNSGFKSNIELYSTSYIDDMIEMLLKKRGILNKKGVFWGYTKFTTNLKFDHKSIFGEIKDLGLQLGSSPKFLQLVQNVDLQYRLSGTRKFIKHQISLPVLVFSIVRNISEDNFIRLNYHAESAKETYPDAKFLIIVETIDKGYTPDVSNSFVDALFILRKQHKTQKTHLISAEVIELLDSKIREYTDVNHRKEIDMIKAKGILE
ncbi:MAG: hypothetical protein CSB55_05305 [Candidatus Cloacimonadota bacterium]|nr:MAG: hypothetical protein CSB55_05305 [Candidatus Cloacimonadota bacterium]